MDALKANLSDLILHESMRGLQQLQIKAAHQALRLSSTFMHKPSDSRVVIHQVSESSQWPKEVLEITALLPQNILNIGQDKPSYAAEIHNAVVEHVPPITEAQYNVQLSAQKRLSDIRDTVLAMVDMLRCHAMSRVDSCDRPTLPIWATLFSTLAMACSQDYVVMYVSTEF